MLQNVSPCRVHVFTHTACEAQRSFDDRNMYNVFFWVEKSLRTYPWLVSDPAAADLIFVNASLNPYDKKAQRGDSACKKAMLDGLTRISKPVFGVSFHISGHGKGVLLFKKGSRPPTAWITMEPWNQANPQTRVVVAPYVVRNDRSRLMMEQRRLAWRSRKLLFFASYIPKTYMVAWFGWRTQIRFNLWKELRASPDVTVRLSWGSCAPGRCDPLYYNHTSSRLSPHEYLDMAMKHRFCVVAPGDTLSTKKLAETVWILASGGCVPLILGGTSHLPYSSWIKYERLAVVAPPHDSSYDLEKLRNVGDDAYRRMASYARSVVRHFVQDPNSSWSSPHAAETVIGETCRAIRTPLR